MTAMASLSKTRYAEVEKLTRACDRGQTSVVSSLLAAGLGVNTGERQGVTALHCAMLNNHAGVVRLLLARPELRLDLTTDEGDTPLHAACQYSAAAVVPLFCADNRVTPEMLNRKNNQGWTPLMAAVSAGNLDCVKELVKVAAVDINAQDFLVSDGSTALHLATGQSNTKLVQELLQRPDIRLDLATEGANTALHTACTRQHSSVSGLRLLLHHPACSADLVNTKNSLGETPLQLAVRNGYLDRARELARLLDLQVNTRNHAGETALHIAMESNQASLVRLLLDRPDSRLDVLDNLGRTPLHAACYSNSAAVILLFCEDSRATASTVNIVDEEGNTGLLAAVTRGHLASVKKLARAGAVDWTARTREGKSLLEAAGDCWQCIQYLKRFPQVTPLLAVKTENTVKSDAAEPQTKSWRKLKRKERRRAVAAATENRESPESEDSNNTDTESQHEESDDSEQFQPADTDDARNEDAEEVSTDNDIGDWTVMTKKDRRSKTKAEIGRRTQASFEMDFPSLACSVNDFPPLPGRVIAPSLNKVNVNLPSNNKEKLKDCEINAVKKELDNKKDHIKYYIEKESSEMTTVIQNISSTEDRIQKLKKKVADREQKVVEITGDIKTFTAEMNEGVEIVAKLEEHKRELEARMEKELYELNKGVKDLEDKLSVIDKNADKEIENYLPEPEESKEDKMIGFLDRSISAKERELECPACLEIPTAPVFMCPDSHLICQNCRPMLSRCPMCRIPYTGPARRHRFAEQSLLELRELQSQKEMFMGA